MSAAKTNIAIDIAMPSTQRFSLPQSSIRLRLSLGLAFIDLVAICGSFILASQIRLGAGFHPNTLSVLAVMIPIFGFIGINNSLYTVETVVSGGRSARRAILAMMAASAVLLVIAFFLKVGAEFSRFLVGAGIVLAASLIAIARWHFARFANWALNGKPWRTIILQDGLAIEAVLGSSIVDVVSSGLKPDVNDPQMLSRIGHAVWGGDRVLIACPPEKREAWARALAGTGISIEMLAPELEALGAIGLGSFKGVPTAILAMRGLNFRQKILKRLLDLSILVVAMPIVLPLMIIVALAIKMESFESVFFVQERVGYGNRLFRMYKFRSMSTNDHQGHRSTVRGDDRITVVGRWIRRTSLDELPQLLNVLLGSMSIVGPRPHAVASTADNAYFWEVDERYWIRHSVPPGVTGLAQVKGFRGATHQRSDLSDRLNSDLAYLEGWTVWRDIKIIFATFSVIMHRNAY